MAALAPVAASVDPADRRDARTAAAVALVTSVSLNVAAAVLQATFAFPGILRRPAAEALARFAEHAAAVTGAYYLFALASLLQAVLVLALRRLLARPGSLALDVATAAGLGMALVQAMGFLRWVFMEPALLAMVRAPGATTSSHDAILVVHETMNRYAGVAVGEHLGWLLLATWLVATGLHAWQRPTRWIGRRIAAVAIGCGLLTAIASVEQFGVVSAVVDAIFYGGYVAYSLLLVPLAVRFLVVAREPHPTPAVLAGGARVR